jgi:hypothetical protein
LKAFPLRAIAVPIIQSPEQQPETISPAVEKDILYAKHLILAEKRRALSAKKRALVAECLATNEKSKAMAVKKTLFAVESLILEDKIRDLAVEQIALMLKLNPSQSNAGF